MAELPAAPEGATEACARNASELLKDADILTSKGSHARACALTILAFEEYAKAFLYRTLELGVASYDCDVSKPGTLMRLCRHVMTDHRSKHAVIRGALMGLKVLPNDLSRATVVDADGKMAKLLLDARDVKTPEDRKRFVAGIGKLANDWTQINAQVRRWEALKESALYVDVKDGHLVEPHAMIGPESVKEVRKSLDEWLAMNERFVAGPMPKIEEGEMVEVFQILKSGSLIQSLPPRFILCNGCERQRRQSPAAVDQSRALPKRV